MRKKPLLQISIFAAALTVCAACTSSAAPPVADKAAPTIVQGQQNATALPPIPAVPLPHALQCVTLGLGEVIDPGCGDDEIFHNDFQKYTDWALTNEGTYEDYARTVVPYYSSGTEPVGALRPTEPTVSSIIPQDFQIDGGGWSISFVGVDAAGVPTAFGGGGCAGRFFDPNKVNGTLEWGVEQTCSGNFAPQYIRFRLQSTCTDWYCQRFNNETYYTRTPRSEDYTRTSRRLLSLPCETDGMRKYRVHAIPYARGVAFRSKFSEEIELPCDISS